MTSTWANVDDQYRNNKDLKKSDVELLKEWLKLQPHLPPITELELILFLHSCHYSNEAAKKCIDNFYTARTHSPDFFKNTNPFGEDVTKTVDRINIVPLPKFTPEGYGMVYTRMIDVNPNVYSFTEQTKLFSMVLGVWIRQVGCLNGIVIVMDMTGSTLSHLAKASLVDIKKLLYFVQEAIPIRMKGIYYVNPTPIVDKIMMLVRPLISKDLQDVFKVLPAKEIFKYLSPDNLPAEVGGNLGPISKIRGNQLAMLREHAQFFDMDEKRVSDESKRPGKPKDSGELFGVEGTFKKLDID